MAKAIKIGDLVTVGVTFSFEGGFPITQWVPGVVLQLTRAQIRAKFDVQGQPVDRWFDRALVKPRSA
jgi:hypothetical protein